MKKITLMIGLILTILFLFNGCGRDSDAVVVDFDKTIPVDRPTSDISQGVTLNVAVAAMISPKETFSYYQDILD